MEADIGTALTKDATAHGPLQFLKEVAKYYMDFLKTDFHKRHTPKRVVRFRNADNLLTGLQLTKYASFTAARKLIHSGFSNGVHQIRKGEYRTSIPENLLSLVRLHVEQITSDQISKVLANISEELRQITILHAKEYDPALSMSLECASHHIRDEIVNPLLATIERPIQNLDFGDENNLYIIEEEIVEVLVQLLSDKLSEALRLLSEPRVPRGLRRFPPIGPYRADLSVRW